MSFSTASYLAGVGSVVAALTIGFSGGFLLAPSTEHMEQNRLQRVSSSAPGSNPAPQTSVGPRLIPEVNSASGPAPATQQPAHPGTIPILAKAVESAPAPVMAKSIDPRAGPDQESGSQDVNSEKMRAADARAAERKRAKAQQSAERRKQREIESATVAVKRMLRDRDPQQVAERAEIRFGFFGED